MFIAKKGQHLRKRMPKVTKVEKTNVVEKNIEVQRPKKVDVVDENTTKKSVKKEVQPTENNK